MKYNNMLSPGLRPPDPHQLRYSLKQPREYDVIIGAGCVSNKHSGNNHFRAVVERHVEDFMNSDDEFRAQITLSIVSHIRSLGGKFVKKEKYRWDAALWFDVGDKLALKKVERDIRIRCRTNSAKKRLNSSQSIPNSAVQPRIAQNPQQQVQQQSTGRVNVNKLGSPAETTVMRSLSVRNDNVGLPRTTDAKLDTAHWSDVGDKTALKRESDVRVRSKITDAKKKRCNSASMRNSTVQPRIVQYPQQQVQQKSTDRVHVDVVGRPAETTASSSLSVRNDNVCLPRMTDAKLDTALCSDVEKKTALKKVKRDIPIRSEDTVAKKRLNSSESIPNSSVQPRITQYPQQQVQQKRTGVIPVKVLATPVETTAASSLSVRNDKVGLPRTTDAELDATHWSDVLLKTTLKRVERDIRIRSEITDAKKKQCSIESIPNSAVQPRIAQNPQQQMQQQSIVSIPMKVIGSAAETTTMASLSVRNDNVGLPRTTDAKLDTVLWSDVGDKIAQTKVEQDFRIRYKTTNAKRRLCNSESVPTRIAQCPQQQVQQQSPGPVPMDILSIDPAETTVMYSLSVRDNVGLPRMTDATFCAAATEIRPGLSPGKTSPPPVDNHRLSREVHHRLAVGEYLTRVACDGYEDTLDMEREAHLYQDAGIMGLNPRQVLAKDMDATGKTDSLSDDAFRRVRSALESMGVMLPVTVISGT